MHSSECTQLGLDRVAPPRYRAAHAHPPEPRYSSPMTDAQSPTAASPAPDIEAIKARFAEQYPRIHRIATLQHRRLHGDKRDDAVADTIALAWKAYRKLAMEGRDPDRLLGSIVRYSAGHVRAGQLLGGKPRVNDVLSRLSRGRHGYFVTSLPSSEEEEAAPEAHAALRHRGAGPAEEAACRVDYADWLATLNEKQRALAEDLASELTITEAAARRGVSHAAVQDMRKTLVRKWDEREGKGR
jgi:hypothetical protein